VKTQHKIVSLPTLKQKIAQHRRRGQTIAFTNGCFDIIHFGHIDYLQKAKKQDRILIVGLNSDSSTRKIKGPLRPIIPQKARAALLAALSCVDYVTIFSQETPQQLISSVKPDILIKGADYRGKPVAGSDVVRSNGGRMEYIKYLPQYSSTKIIKSILKKCR